MILFAECLQLYSDNNAYFFSGSRHNYLCIITGKDVQYLTREQLEIMLNKSNGVVSPQSYFVPVPNSFVRNLNLTVYEKMIFIYLWGFGGGEKKHCYPSQGRMSKELKISKSTIIRNLKTLEEKGFVYVINQYKAITKEKISNLYYLCEIDNEIGDPKPRYFELVAQVYPDKIRIIE